MQCACVCLDFKHLSDQRGDVIMFVFVDREDRDREREASVFRIRDRRWLDNALREEITLSRLEKDRTDGLLSSDGRRGNAATSGGGGGVGGTAGNPLSFGEELQFWPEKDASKPPRFRRIAALHSELVAINTHGQLCQWKWAEPDAYVSSTHLQPEPGAPAQQLYHPKTSMLNLIGENIVGVDASHVRCSLWTESGKVSVLLYRYNYLYRIIISIVW